MSDVEMIPDQELKDMLVQALQNVCSTMMSIDIELQNSVFLPNDEGVEPVSPAIDTSETVITSSIGFTGVVNGVMHISMGEALSKTITCAFLGMEPDEVEAEGHELINDALGEMANMSAGDFKNRICDRGYNCMLTLPSILRGNNVAIECNVEEGVIRQIHNFQACGSPVIVDLIFKPEEK